jgi:hypothetical protein
VFVLYDVLLYLAAIAMLPYVIVAGMVRGKYLVNFPERMGFYKTPPAAHDLWIHAVSVGETLAARPVADEILRESGAGAPALSIGDGYVLPVRLLGECEAFPAAASPARFRDVGNGDLAECDAPFAGGRRADAAGERTDL